MTIFLLAKSIHASSQQKATRASSVAGAINGEYSFPLSHFIVIRANHRSANLERNLTHQAPLTCNHRFVWVSAYQEECLLNLVQAVEASQKQGAYRVVGKLRILVQFRKQKLRVLVQCRSRRHWKLTDSGGSIRYLNGVLRDRDGFWVVASCDLAALDHVANCLPAVYQHLLTPDSDDWQNLEGKEAG